MARDVQIRFRGIDSTGRAVRGVVTGLKSVQRHTKATQALQRSWNKGLNQNRRMVQQFGFQLTDFATQVAGGQSAMLAFTQQGGQMLQFFGPFGAIAAAALAVFGSLAIAVTRSGQSFNTLAPAVALLSDDIQGIVSGLKWLGSVMLDIANVVINNLTAIIGAAGSVAAFFAVKWVASMVTAAVSTNAVRGALAAMYLNMTILGPAAGIAANGVMLLSGALRVLMGALISLGIPALIIGVGLLIQAFLHLRKGAGSTGEAFKLLGDVVAGVVSDMITHVKIFIKNWKIGNNAMIAAFTSALIPMAKKFDEFVANVVAKWNSVFGEYDSLRIDVGWSVADTMQDLNLAAVARIGILSAEVDGLHDQTGRAREAVKALVDAWREGRSSIDLRSAFGGGGAKGDGKGGGGKASPTDEITKEADRIKKIFEDMQKSIANSMMSSFKGLLKGTKSLGDAVADILSNILDNIINILMQPIFNNLAGSIAGGLMGGPNPAVGGGGLLGGLGASFEGGGFTGRGVRSGGVDGKGGRYAVVHPNETVIDHEKGQQMSSGNVYMHVSTPDAPSFKRSQRQLMQRGRRAMGV